MNSAESWAPASICMACSSVKGASTLSEVRVVGLYQYICPPSRKGRCFRCVPHATSTKTPVVEVLEVLLIPAPIDPSSWKVHSPKFTENVPKIWPSGGGATANVARNSPFGG